MVVAAIKSGLWQGAETPKGSVQPGCLALYGWLSSTAQRLAGLAAVCQMGTAADFVGGMARNAYHF